MRTTNKYVYELISVAFGFSIIAFFGTLSFFPMEIMVMGEHQRWYPAIILFTVCIIISFFILNNYPTQHSQIMVISQFLVQILSVVCLLSYFIFNATLTEIWLIQPGWYLRSDGIIVNFLLGAVVLKSASGLSYLVKINAKTDLEIEDGTKIKTNNTFLTKHDIQGQKLTAILIILGFIFYITQISLLRYYTLFAVFIFITIFQFVLTANSLFKIYRKNLTGFCLQNPHLRENKEDTISNRTITEFVLKKPAKKILNDYRGLSIYFIILLVFSISSLLAFPYDLIVFFEIPFGLNTLVGHLSLNILLTSILLVLMLIGFLSYVFRTKSHQKYGKFYSSQIKRSTHLLFFAFIDAMKFLGLFAVISQILYYYDYPIFFPKIVTYYLIFGCVGGLIYYYIGRIRSYVRNQTILYIVSVIILLINLVITYYDGITHGSGIIINPDWNVTFPFLYLHSFINFIMVGIPIGVIISELLFGFLFKDTDGSDSQNRSLFIIFSVFLCFTINPIGNYILNNPGGDPPSSDQTIIAFTLFTSFFLVVLITGLCCHIFYEVIVSQLLRRRKSPPPLNDNFYTKECRKLRNRNPWRESTIKIRDLDKKWKSIILIFFLSISFFETLISYNVYTESFKRPMLVSDPYYTIWVLNSSERVSKTTPLSRDTSSLISSINISSAKNEYNAIQLVWKPFNRQISDLSYIISDFKNPMYSESIDKSNCSLRYVEWVIEDEFPDILRNFTSIHLLSGVNNILWFSIKVPKNVEAGCYSGNITLQFNGDKTQFIHININVWNFSVPDMKHLRTNIGAYSRSDNQIKNYIEHRLNDYGIPIRRAENTTALETYLGYTCYLNETDHTWDFNWTWWDIETQKKLDWGINNFMVEYPFGITYRNRKPYISNATQMLELQNWLTGVENHLESKNWLNYSCMFFVDEFALFIPDGYTRAGYFADLLILAQKIKEAAPKLRIVCTAPPTEELKDFEPYFDVYCPVTRDRDKSKWNELMSQGKEFWMYASVGPLSPYPSAHLYNRLFEIRILFWQTWLYQIDGFLYWQAQAYYHGKNSLAFNGYGDGWFIYQENDILYDSLRWENFLEAQEDYEYLWLLNASLTLLQTDPHGLSENVIEEMWADFNNMVNTIVGEKTLYTNNPKKIYEARHQLGISLSFISNYIDISSFAELTWSWL